MTKYIRSKTKLIALINDIFGVCEISPDTKAIVLVLAGTLPSKKFKRWIDRIPQLNPFNAHFKQINALRWEYGTAYRNYILITAMQAVEQDVCSDELQGFIRVGDECTYKEYSLETVIAPLIFRELDVSYGL